jgi:hypothetical protein
MTIKTGYKQDVKGSWIPKDPDAQLVYAMDWGTEWLAQGNSISAVTYTVSTITGDTTPLTIESSGIQAGGITYVELSGGKEGEIYTVTCTVTTSGADVDARRFRIKVEDRYL